MCVYYMTGAPEGSPKVVLRTCNPWFTELETSIQFIDLNVSKVYTNDTMG